MTRQQVCVHCGAPLPAGTPELYCIRHGGRYPPVPTLTQPRLPRLPRGDGLRPPDRGNPPPVTCAGCDRPLRPGSHPPNGHGFHPLCARCRGLAA